MGSDEWVLWRQQVSNGAIIFGALWHPSGVLIQNDALPGVARDATPGYPLPTLRVGSAARAAADRAGLRLEDRRGPVLYWKISPGWALGVEVVGVAGVRVLAGILVDVVVAPGVLGDAVHVRAVPVGGGWRSDDEGTETVGAEGVGAGVHTEGVQGDFKIG